MTEPELPVIVRFDPDSNEPELVKFYTALGMCVSSWAFIDRRLYEIFHGALGMGARQSALIYYRQRAFNQRLRLVDDSIRTVLQAAKYESKWKPIHVRIIELSHTRNIFAHHPTRRTGTSVNGEPVYIYTIHIEQYERILNNEYKGLLGKNHLDVDDLRQHEEAIEVLERDLRWFNEAILTPECDPQNPLRNDAAKP